MEDKYHKQLTSVLNEFEKSHSNKLSKYNYSFKLTSNKRHSKSLIEYQPDFCFSFKTGKKSSEYIVFEFLDTQNDEGIFADIVECACIRNCRMLLFLVKEGKRADRCADIADIACNLLDELKGDKLLLVVTLHIPSNMNEEEIKKAIFDEINRELKLT